MEFKKIFERKKPTISPEEQEAFQELGKELIFTEDLDVPLTLENIPRLSQALQTQFIGIQETRRKKNMEQFQEVMDRFGLSSEEERNKFMDDTAIFSSSLMDLPEKEFLKHMFVRFGMTAHFDQGNGYDSRGFTPKLAQYENKENVEANCVGFTTMFGTYCRRRGLNVELGITPDHPVVVVEAEGKKFIVDGQSAPLELHGIFEQKDGYKVYRASPEDRHMGLDDTPEDPIDQKILMVHDFDNAILYEVLENVAILSDISKDVPVDTVPGSRREVDEVAKEHSGVLQRADWRAVQSKLFPTIEKSFSENTEEWTAEVLRMKNFRRNERKDSVMFDLLFLAQNETSFKGMDFNASQIALRSMFQKYAKDIKAFFIYSFEFNKAVPEDVKNFFTAMRDLLRKEDPEVAKYIRDRMWSKINI